MNMWPAPLGVIFLLASQSAKSGVRCTTSEARSRALLGLPGNDRGLQLGGVAEVRCADRSAKDEYQEHSGSSGDAACRHGRNPFRGRRAENCRVIWRGGGKRQGENPPRFLVEDAGPANDLNFIPKRVSHGRAKGGAESRIVTESVALFGAFKRGSAPYYRMP